MKNPKNHITKQLAIVLFVCMSLFASTAIADKADRTLRRQKSDIAQFSQQLAGALSETDIDLLLRSIARYDGDTLQGLLTLLDHAPTQQDQDSNPTTPTTPSEPGEQLSQISTILKAFPEITKFLSQIYKNDPTRLRQVLQNYSSALSIVDNKARKEWIKILKNSPSATSQLVNVARFFKEEFDHTITLRNHFQAKVEAARTKAKEIERNAKRQLYTTVVVVEDPYAPYYRSPYFSNHSVGYPYSTYSAYSWTRSTVYPYYGFTGNPYAGIRELEKESMSVWQLPSYQVIHYILANADMYSELADKLIELYQSTRTPETFRGAIEAWQTANKKHVDAVFLAKSGREVRLAKLAASRKKALREDTAVKCRPGTATTPAPEEKYKVLCPESIFDRYLMPRPDGEIVEIRPIQSDYSDYAEEHFRRIRNIHGAIWAGLAFKQLPKDQ